MAICKTGGTIQVKQTGRTKTCYSVASQRMSEYGVRRLDLTISKLKDLVRHRELPPRGICTNGAAYAAFLHAEIADARRRMRVLPAGK